MRYIFFVQNDGPYDVFINLNKIAELTTIDVSETVTLGANVKISDAINSLETADNEVWRGIAHHMRQIELWYQKSRISCWKSYDEALPQ